MESNEIVPALTPLQLAQAIVNGEYTKRHDSLRILALRVLELEALVDDLNCELDDLYGLDEDDLDSLGYG